jgi:hypothetical protein
MNPNAKKLLVLAAAVAGGVCLHKVADREAKQLGIPLVAVAVLTWALSQ